MLKKTFIIILVFGIIVYAIFCIFGYAEESCGSTGDIIQLTQTTITETKIYETILPEVITWENVQVQSWD